MVAIKAKRVWSEWNGKLLPTARASLPVEKKDSGGCPRRWSNARLEGKRELLWVLPSSLFPMTDNLNPFFSRIFVQWCSACPPSGPFSPSHPHLVWIYLSMDSCGQDTERTVIAAWNVFMYIRGSAGTLPSSSSQPWKVQGIIPKPVLFLPPQMMKHLQLQNPNPCATFCFHGNPVKCQPSAPQFVWHAF